MNATLNANAFESESKSLERMDYGSIFLYWGSLKTLSQNSRTLIISWLSTWYWDARLRLLGMHNGFEYHVFE